MAVGRYNRTSADAGRAPPGDLFGIGASWGGFESLIQPTTPARIRTASRWEPEGPTLRLHIGLEDPQDLIEDLDRGFHALRAAEG
ncbi:MAG: PLP-dependent transferase [Stellaceae bacterium]